MHFSSIQQVGYKEMFLWKGPFIIYGLVWSLDKLFLMRSHAN
jgi:hypothetical protein